MCTATSLGIHSLDVDDPKLFSRDGSSLIESESEFFFRLVSFHDRFVYCYLVLNNLIGFLFYESKFLVTDGFVVGDVQSRTFNAFMRSSLPDVWTKYSTCCCINDVGCGVVDGKLLASFWEYLA